MKNFRCAMCDEWYSHKRKRILKEIFSSKCENYDIALGAVPKFNLMDIIVIMMVVDVRIENYLKENRNLEEFISILSMIPLHSSKIYMLGIYSFCKILGLFVG